MANKTKYLKQLSLFLILGVFTRGLSFFTSPFFYSVLSKDDYILYDNLNNFISWFSIVGIGGYSTILAKNFISLDGGSIFTLVRKVGVRALMLSLIAALLLIGFNKVSKNPFIQIDTWGFFLLLIVMSVTFTLKKFVETVLRFNKANLLYYFSLLLPVLAIIPIIFIKFNILNFILWLSSLSYFVSSFLFKFVKYTPAQVETAVPLVDDSKERMGFMISSLILGGSPLLERFILLQNVDSVFYLHYINAARILSLFGFLTQTIQLYTAPNLYKYITSKSYDSFFKNSRTALIAVYIAYILLCIGAIVLVPLFFPNKYSSKLIFQCTVSSGFSLLLSYFIYSIFITIEYSQKYMRHLIAVIIINAVLYVFLFFFHAILWLLLLFPISKLSIVYSRYYYSDDNIKVYLLPLVNRINLFVLIYLVMFGCSVFLF